MILLCETYVMVGLGRGGGSWIVRWRGNTVRVLLFQTVFRGKWSEEDISPAIPDLC